MNVEPPEFRRCPWCRSKSIEVGVIDPECDDCGYTGYCSNCGDGPLGPDDMVAATACSNTCEAEMAEQAQADALLADRHL